MPSINMIAARRAEKKRLEKLVNITFLVIAGELVITLGMLGFMTARVHAANKSIAKLDGQLVKLQPTVDKIHRYEGDIKELEPRLNLLSDSRERTMLWYSILRDLSHSMPEKTWLTSIATTVPPAQPTDKTAPAPELNICGSTTRQGLVGETMLRLNQFPEFSSVDLTFTQEAGSETSKTLQFQVLAKVKPVDSKEGGASKNAEN
jgi:Tfp pilus assembly protein PilN